MKILPILSVLAAFVTFPFSAQATVIYSQYSMFWDALGDKFVDDYESPLYQYIQNDVDMSAVHNETKYVTTGWPDINVVSRGALWLPAYYTSGGGGSVLLDFTSTSVSNSLGIFGVGINFKNVDVSDFDGAPVVDLDEFSAFVTFGDGLSENFILPSGVFADDFFWGITSIRGIKTIHFGLWDGVPVQSDTSFVLHDLTIGSQKTIVSEPSHIWMMVVLFLGILLLRRSTKNLTAE